MRGRERPRLGSETLPRRWGREGPAPQAWEGGGYSSAAGGDDYAMMREVFRRRFGRALKEDPERERGMWPDLVLIDGGLGQLSSVAEVFAELGIEDVALV